MPAQKPMTDFSRIAEPLYEQILLGCQRIVGMDGEPASVATLDTMFVLDGRLYTVSTRTRTFRFWFGANGHRLFFIAYMKDLLPDPARNLYEFSFGAAAKVGWDVNYQPMEGGVSIWATCMTNKAEPLVQIKPDMSSILPREQTFEITADGHFWATDVALMVQSWIRTSERHNLHCHDKEPAPL